MKIAFIINKVETEKANYTTIQLAMRAMHMGHSFYLVDAADLSYGIDGGISAYGRTVNGHRYRSVDKFLKSVQEAELKKFEMRDMEIMFIRTDPSEEKPDRLWAQNSPYMFGLHAMEKDDVIVLNHPCQLANAINKLYFQHYPQELRPEAIITRNEKEIWDFYREHKHKVILKPLQGSGGENVFLVEKKTEKNMNQIIEAISRDGYIIAQEYLPKGQEGDVRLLMINGEILRYKDQPAILRRLNKGSDIRSNISAGGSYAKARMTPEIERIAEILKPKLVRDGMFFIGVDIIGDKLIEINVFSAGGLPMVSELYGVQFDEVMIRALEHKVTLKNDYSRKLDNLELNTL